MNTIRKFGLEYCDLPTMLWNATVLLRVMTLNIDKRYKKRIPIIYYIATTVVIAGCLYVYVVSSVWFIAVKCTETGDVVAAMVILSLGISSQISTTKLLFIFLKEDLVRELVEGYLQCDSLVIPKSRLEENIKKTLRVVKKRAITFWLVIISNGIVYCVKPIIMPGRRLMDDTLVLYGLEPMYESPNYEIAYFLCMLGVICTCYLPANITGFLIFITGYTEAQLIALSKEITYLWADAEEYYKKGRAKIIPIISNEAELKRQLKNDYVQKELIGIVQRHTINIKLLKGVENVFKGAIALEFALLVIALIAELLGGLENTYIEMPFALIQVAMDCLVGQRVIDASIMFENAVYDSKWENFDTGNMKTVLLVLQNTQKTLTLSAGGVTMLSFTSLLAIMKSIYSTYTTLRSTVK